jgi:2-pyrone-4,6-dicarboxylate lactonase
MSSHDPVAAAAVLPRGACNAHCHVFGPRDRFPYAPGADAAPDAPKEALYALNDRLGLSRCVVVQSARHGFDNRATEEAVAGRPGRYRGIALLPTGVADAELKRLHAAGFRGARFHYMARLGPPVPIDEVLQFARRLEPLGWHLLIHGDPSLLTELGPALRRSPVPVVIDHMGRVDASLGITQPAFRALLWLLEDPRFWVKLSGSERLSRQGPPYADALPFAQRLLQHCGDRVLWGNDWPHPNLAGPVPDDDFLVALIHRIAPDEAARQRMLVDNPQRLYGFDEEAA